MNGFNYCCKNDDCSEAWQTVIVYVSSSEENKNQYCGFCDESMKRLGRLTYGGVAKFASLPPNEKQKVLKKRSREHFAKDKYDKFHQRNKKTE